MTEQRLQRQRFLYESKCKHCDKRVILIPFAIHDKWVHQVINHSFADGTYEFCKVTRAEPYDK